MGNKIYTGKQRVEIAQQEYNHYKEQDPVKIGKNKIKIGEVSQIFNKPTGEQSFVITDHYVPLTASLKEREVRVDAFLAEIEKNFSFWRRFSQKMRIVF